MGSPSAPIVIDEYQPTAHVSIPGNIQCSLPIYSCLVTSIIHSEQSESTFTANYAAKNRLRARRQLGRLPAETIQNQGLLRRPILGRIVGVR